MIKLGVFIILSTGIIILSWRSLRNRHAHGFYRFFAFESIIVLLLINIDSWFTDPFSVTQIVSWVLLIGSIVMAVQGFYLLHTFGRPGQGIEDTSVLVKTGVYRYIRHPLYSSLILVAWGIFFKEPALLSAALAITVTVFSIATAKIEERENLARFGEAYADYMKSTRMFLPFLF